MYLIFMYYFHLSFPLVKSVVNRKTRVEWYTDELARGADRVRDLFDLYRGSKDPILLNEYKKQKEIYRRMVNETKKKHFMKTKYLTLIIKVKLHGMSLVK